MRVFSGQFWLNDSLQDSPKYISWSYQFWSLNGLNSSTEVTPVFFSRPYFLVDKCSVWSAGRKWVIHLYLKESDNFIRLIF